MIVSPGEILWACALAVTWITSPRGSALKLRKKPRVSAEDLTQAFDRLCSDFAQPGGGQTQARTILTNGHGQSVCSPSMLAAQPIADSYRAELTFERTDLLVFRQEVFRSTNN
jgi:hypothetical protein